MGELPEPWKCPKGHTVAAWVRTCPDCGPVTKSVTKRPKKRDETPSVTKVCDETPRGRPKKYKNRAEQQAAYRERRK